MKQQFNVNLDPALIRRVKHRSIDAQLSLSDLVGHVLTAYLDRSTTMPEIDLTLQPMVHVRQVSAMVDFLAALGGEVVHGSRDGDWVQVSIGGAEVGILGHPANPEQGEGDVELNFESRTPLEQVEQAARDAGVEVVAPVSDQGFGRQLQVRSPDGLLVKINELDPDLFS